MELLYRSATEVRLNWIDAECYCGVSGHVPSVTSLCSKPLGYYDVLFHDCTIELLCCYLFFVVEVNSFYRPVGQDEIFLCVYVSLLQGCLHCIEGSYVEFQISCRMCVLSVNVFVLCCVLICRCSAVCQCVCFVCCAVQCVNVSFCAVYVVQCVCAVQCVCVVCLCSAVC